MYFSYFSSLYLFMALIFLLGVGFFLFKDIFTKKEKNLFYFLSNFALFFSLICIVFALFGPRTVVIESHHSTQKNDPQKVAFVVDVSNSMNTLDINPDSISRLDAAKLFIENYIQSSKNSIYSLSIFAGSGDRKLPFTEDINLFQSFLKNISSEDSIKTGTDINKAFETGLLNFSHSSGGILYILTDGGEDDKILTSYKKQLEDKKISLILVGIGSEKGDFIPIGRDVFGNIRYKIYEGEKVLTKRESKILSGIASELGGKYFEISSEVDIKKLLKNLEGIESVSFTPGKKDNLEGSLIPFFVLLSLVSFLISLCTHIILLGKRL